MPLRSVVVLQPLLRCSDAGNYLEYSVFFLGAPHADAGYIPEYSDYFLEPRTPPHADAGNYPSLNLCYGEQHY